MSICLTATHQCSGYVDTVRFHFLDCLKGQKSLRVRFDNNNKMTMSIEDEKEITEVKLAAGFSRSAKCCGVFASLIVKMIEC
jgi:hypothetical protein